MAFNNEQQRLIDAAKDLYLLKYKDKTDEELDTISNHLRTVGVFSSNTAEALKALGELEACNIILAQRQEQKKYKKYLERCLQFTLPMWKKAMVERRKKAILNLPTASSYHGQLVASVLEEENNLSAEEIRQWTPDLMALNDDQYHDLLNKLVGEKIIAVKDGTYSLVSLCTPDLHPTDPMLWAKSCSKLFDRDAKIFLQRMIETGKPLTEHDWIELNGSDYDKKTLAENPKYANQSAKIVLSIYVEDGIFSITPITKLDIDSLSWIAEGGNYKSNELPGVDLNYYYFPILGEKEAE